MTALQQALEAARQINQIKANAIRTGKNVIEYEYDGKIHHQYYHGSRWNDRPSAVAEYHGQI